MRRRRLRAFPVPVTFSNTVKTVIVVRLLISAGCIE